MNLDINVIMYKTSYLDAASRKCEQYHAKYGTHPWKANSFFLLWSLKQLFKFNRPMRSKADNICRVGFELKGGVGDILVSLNYLQCLHQFLEGKIAFDLYALEKRDACKITQVLCREQNFVKQVHPISHLKNDYDLYITITRYPEIQYLNESKISSLCPKLYQWCQKVDEFRKDNPVVYRTGTYGDYLGRKHATLQGQNRLQQADIGNQLKIKSVFQPKIFADTQGTLAKFSLENRRFITLQRGVGGGNRSEATKLWPMSHYETLVKGIKERMPDVSIVQLGILKNLPINGVDLDLRNKTSFEDVMVLVQQSSCHIDGECGLVHLRHFLKGGTSIVMFGPTEEQFYGYAENINMRSDSCLGGCEWITPVYNKKCPRGFAENVCLKNLAPEVVLTQVLKVIENGTRSDLREPSVSE
ncbi:MAG: glycosyltransferase family 9 protein [Thermoguttaceae bacterium]